MILLRINHVHVTTKTIFLSLFVKAVLFRSKGTTYEATSKLHLHDSVIDFSSTAKALGIVFHEHMLWDSQTEMVRNKLSKVLGMLRRCQSFLPTTQMLMIYNTLFSSQLRYGLLVWGTGTLHSKQKLLTLQKNALRSIANAEYNAHTLSLFNKFRVVRFDNMYEYCLLASLKTEINKGSNNLISIACLERSTSSRPTRQSDYWKVPRCRTNYGLQMLKHSLPHILNKFTFSLERLRLLSRQDMSNIFLPS